jgi:hypothetical protein
MRRLLIVLLVCAVLPSTLSSALVAAARASTVTLASGPAWTTYTADPGAAPNPAGPTALGPAQLVCLTDSTPNCPAGAVSWGYAFGYPWPADLSSMPGAWWIWAPGLTRESPASGATYWFSRTVVLAGTPLAGSIILVADDVSTLFVNGTNAGEGGPLEPLDVGPYLKAGDNVITVKGGNCDSCGEGPYSDNPAGAVFGGTITYRAAGERDGTKTNVDWSPSAPIAGEPVTLGAAVTDTLDPGRTPTGAVQFSVDGIAVGSPRPLVAGAAELTGVSLTAGSRAFKAVYQPDSTSFATSSDTANVSVGAALTRTTLSVAPDPTVAGQVATFTALVAPTAAGQPTPTGLVQFTEDDGSPLGSPQPLDAGGQATLDVWGPAGSYRVHANYLGDAQFQTSTASVLQQINRADTTTRITSSPNPVAPGGTLNITVTVAVNPPGDIPTYGNLQFMIDGVPFGGPIALNGAAGIQASVRVPTLPSTNTIAVAYSGDANTNPSAASLRQTIGSAGGSAGGSAPGSPAGPSGAPAATSAQQLTAMTSVLIRALKARGAAALTGTAQTLTVPAPGVLTQTVYSATAAKSALASKTRKRVVVASGRHTFAAAGKGTLRQRLTSAGRRAIRRVKSLKIAIVTRFTPTNGTAVAVVQRLTVRARRPKVAGQRADWGTIIVQRASTPAHVLEPRAPRSADAAYRIAFYRLSW